MHAPLLAHLHTELLAAYRALLPDNGPEDWWRLPVEEPYIWDHLVEHLRGAGAYPALAATVTDPCYLTQRIILGSGPHAAETDLAHAATALPADPVIGWWRAWIARHAHLLAVRARSRDTGPDTITAATMYAWLDADLSRHEHHIDPARLTPLLPTPHLQVRWGLTPPPTTLIRALTGHTGGVSAVAWSPDGSRLATAGDGDGSVRVWDPVAGTQAAVLDGHTGGVRAVAWSPDGSRLATAGDDGSVRVRVWDPVAGTQAAVLTGHTGGVSAVAWSPDGSRLAAVSNEGVLAVRDITRGETDTQLNLDQLTDVSWTAAGIAIASDNGLVVLDLC
ncbi:MAG: WD40 repeat domain-containing protein [Pseudonocardia sp.]